MNAKYISALVYAVIENIIMHSLINFPADLAPGFQPQLWSAEWAKLSEEDKAAFAHRAAEQTAFSPNNVLKNILQQVRYHTRFF